MFEQCLVSLDSVNSVSGGSNVNMCTKYKQCSSVNIANRKKTVLLIVFLCKCVLTFVMFFTLLGVKKHIAHHSTGLVTCDHAFLVSSVSGPSLSSLLAKLSVVNVGGGTSSNP